MEANQSEALDRRRFRSPFASGPSPAEKVPLASLGPVPFALFSAAMVLYVVHVVLAIAADRHLFGDASWFLVKLLSEGHVAIWTQHWPWDFYVSRIGTFSIFEGPTLLASRLLPENLRVLSAVFGASLFLHKPLSLAVCYWVAPDKRFVLFPAASIFAATINAEMYICSETHLVISLFWMLLFLVVFSEPLTLQRRLFVIALSLPTVLCYETWAVFGTVLAAASLWPAFRRGAGRTDRAFRVCLAAWYLLGAALAVFAIVHPRDFGNRANFLVSLLSVSTSVRTNPGILASWVAAFAMLGLVLAGPSRRWMIRALVSVSLVASALVVVRILARPDLTDFGLHVAARAFHLPIPLGLAFVFLLAYTGSVTIDRKTFGSLFVVLSVLGLAQTTWNLLATTEWSNMLALMRQELRSRSGPIPYDESVLSRPGIGGQPPGAPNNRWALLPLSILESDRKIVKSLVVFTRDGIGTFRPFDAERENQFPRLERFGFDARPYFEALAREQAYQLGQVVDFTSGGNASRFRTGSWWAPEPWATWTAGSECGLELPLAGRPPGDLRLDADVGAFVSRENPIVTADVSAGGCALGRWEFPFSTGGGKVGRRSVLVPSPCLAPDGRAIIRFVIKGAAAPRALGLGGDPRPLGLAFVRAALVRADAPEAPGRAGKDPRQAGRP